MPNPTAARSDTFATPSRALCTASSQVGLVPSARFSVGVALSAEGP